MKHLKRLGLAAIMVLGLMALAGAGSASATTLATDSAGTVKYGEGTEIKGSLGTGTATTLTNTSGETIAYCTHTISGGRIVSATGTWVSVSNSLLTWEGCNQTTDTLNAGSLGIMQTFGDEGEVVGKGMEVTINVFGLSCVYGFGEGTTLGTITGGESPTLKITAVVPRVAGGFLCPSTAIWHAVDLITTPHAVHIVS